ncbi:MAG: FAD-dependent monooxygenase [Hyphomicrobiaceae bacterium]
MSPPRSDYSDICIVGTGYSGLLLALALETVFEGDISITVVGPEYSHLKDRTNPRAFAISASSRRFLDNLGIWQRIEDTAQPVMRIELSDSPLEAGVRPVLLTYNNILDTGLPASYIVPAAELGRAIADVLHLRSSVSIIQNGLVNDVSSRPGYTDVAINGQQGCHAGLVVCADGPRSALRKRLGIETVGWNYDQIGIVTTVRHAQPHHGLAVQHFLPAGPFAILPLVGNQSCITWSEQTARAKKILTLDDDDFLNEIDLRFGGRLGPLSLAGSRKSFPLSLSVARVFVGTRLALVGDAAHVVHPIAGQGLNLAIRDIASLAECLADGARLGLDLGDHIVLDRYQKWRRFDSTLSAGVFDGLNRVFTIDQPLVRSLREIGLGVIDQLPSVKALIVSEAAGVTGQLPKLLTTMPR